MSDWQTLRGSLTTEKRAWDATYPWIAYVCRPISYPISYLCHRMGMTANHVTAITAVLGLASLPLMASGSRTAMFSAGLCLVCYSILDCVDGNLARAFPASGPPVGKLWDQLVGNFYTLSYFAMGIGLAQSYPSDATLWPMVGAFITIGKYLAYQVRYVFWKVLGDDWNRQKERASSGYVPRVGKWYYRVYHSAVHLQGHVVLLPLVIMFDLVDVFLIASGVVTVGELGTCVVVYLRRSWQMKLR